MVVKASPPSRVRLFAALALLSAFPIALLLIPRLLGSTAPVVTPPHTVWVIVMENRADTSIIHSKSAPYLNSLIRQYGLADNYRAIVHGSQPNYIALFSGGLQGVKGNESVSLPARNIADQLEAAGETWRVFAENVPPNCYVGATATGGPDGPGTYARKHEPAISFGDISSNPARCANINDFTAFDPMVANFELIVPNLENDMHNGTTIEGDDFLRGFVPRILASAAWQSGSPLFITWDEGKAQGDNRIATLVIAKEVTPGFTSKVPHTHYSLLHTVEALLGLPCLGQACKANTLAEFLPRELRAQATSSP
jgi:phosphatidylinositol-3-phosphatase